MTTTTESDHILVEDGVVFDGTREQFAASFFSNADDAQIRDWAAAEGWSVTIEAAS